ncbi:uncharacterized protein CIMG_12727 [Coccidioides immitis RS]|uniref:Uncharacterized protein n=1 Tax=Coccidioides immitis (strain RS) TaxID=246410 RepID=J3KKH4_COCIM|nr:uncharacterized protein CIMG_12727 [Coccidioides immitis RS]EAS36675.3 hypothetical protein CIMG_12727 [Coccidioides immitis RS]
MKHIHNTRGVVLVQSDDISRFITCWQRKPSLGSDGNTSVATKPPACGGGFIPGLAPGTNSIPFRILRMLRANGELPRAGGKLCCRIRATFAGTEPRLRVAGYHCPERKNS